MPKKPTKYPTGTWEKAAQLYKQRTGKDITGLTLRGRFYSTFDEEIQICVDMSVEYLTKLNVMRELQTTFDFLLTNEYTQDYGKRYACHIRYWPVINENTKYSNVGIFLFDTNSTSSYLGSHFSYSAIAEQHDSFSAHHIPQLFQLLMSLDEKVTIARKENKGVELSDKVSRIVHEHSAGYREIFFLSRFKPIKSKSSSSDYFKKVLKTFPNQRNEFP